MRQTDIERERHSLKDASQNNFSGALCSAIQHKTKEQECYFTHRYLSVSLIYCINDFAYSKAIGTNKETCCMLRLDPIYCGF